MLHTRLDVFGPRWAHNGSESANVHPPHNFGRILTHRLLVCRSESAIACGAQSASRLTWFRLALTPTAPILSARSHVRSRNTRCTAPAARPRPPAVGGKPRSCPAKFQNRPISEVMARLMRSLRWTRARASPGSSTSPTTSTQLPESLQGNIHNPGLYGTHRLENPSFRVVSHRSLLES